MSTKSEKQAEKQAEQDLPEVASEEQSQVTVWQSADTDQATGETVTLGTPEIGDEELAGSFIEWLQAKSEAASADTMAQLISALRKAEGVQDIKEAVAEMPTVNGRDIIGQPFLAHGFTIHEGKFEDDEIPYFASIDASKMDGSARVIVNCGGLGVLVHLHTFERLGKWPIPLCFTGKPTRKGFTVLSFDYLGE